MGPFASWCPTLTSRTESGSDSREQHDVGAARRPRAGGATDPGRSSVGATGSAVPVGRLLVAAVGALALLFALAFGAPAASAADPCAAPVTSVIACENTKPGNPPTEWQVTEPGPRRSRGSRRR
jgi:hypothetical protein